MIAQGAAAAGVSAETTSATPEPGAAEDLAPQPGNDVVEETAAGQPGSLAAELLSDIESEQPEEIERSKPAPKPKPQSGKAEDEPEPVAAGPKAKADGEGKGTDEEDHPVPDEWPATAKARIADETTKRKTRTTERDTALKRAADAEGREKQLREQMSTFQPVQVAPTDAEPLAGVNSLQELGRVKQQYEELLDFAAAHPDGVEGVVLKKGTDGAEDITRDYSKEDIAAIKLKAERLIREHLPQRVTYLRERQGFDAAARKLYTDKHRVAEGLPAIGADLVFDESGQLTQDAKMALQLMPSLLRFSDAYLNLGRYLRGLKAEQDELRQLGSKKPGSNGKSPTVKAILEDKPERAPAVTVARTTALPQRGGKAGGNDAEIERAEKAAIEAGGDESAVEDLIGAILDKNDRRSAAPAEV